MKRGEIYYIASYQQEVGSEQRAGRPAVIVSNNKCNETSEVVEVCYLTTQPKNDMPTHVTTRGTGIVSTIICEQISSVSVSRIDGYVGALSESEQVAVDAALAISLGINPQPVMVKREPTEEELKKLAEEYIANNVKLVIPDKKPDDVPDIDAVKSITKLKTECAIYKRLFEDMWRRFMVGDTITGGDAE